MLAIIGSGLSGAAVAQELGRMKVEHVLLDAGPDWGLEHVGTSSVSEELSSPAKDSSFESFTGSGQSPYGPATGYRLRVGGRGLYWRGICLRVESGVLSDWPEVARRAAESWYPVVERELCNWVGCSLTEPRSDDEERLLSRINAAGYTATATPRAVRFGEDGRWSAYTPITGIGRERIRAGFRVSDVLRRPGRGFLVHGERDSLMADGVILAAGLFQNARLVDRILGARHELRIVDHVAAGFVVFAAGADHDPRDASVFAGSHSAASSNLFVESQRVDGGILIDAWAMGEQRPEAATLLSDGRVTLGELARKALALVGREQRLLLAELANALGFNAPRDDGLDFDTAVARATAAPGVAFGYIAGLGELDHESSGLSLGTELVDETGGLRGAPGVHVVGPCLFPRIGAANPTLTTLALSRHVAAAASRT